MYCRGLVQVAVLVVPADWCYITVHLSSGCPLAGVAPGFPGWYRVVVVPGAGVRNATRRAGDLCQMSPPIQPNRKTTSTQFVLSAPDLRNWESCSLRTSTSLKIQNIPPGIEMYTTTWSITATVASNAAFGGDVMVSAASVACMAGMVRADIQVGLRRCFGHRSLEV